MNSREAFKTSDIQPLVAYQAGMQPLCGKKRGD